MTDEKLQQLLDEREIINVINGIGIDADRGDWNGVSGAFADVVLLDYSSMGAPAENLPPAEIVVRWKAVLPGFKMTQHSITNHRITVGGDEAGCFSYVTAKHFLPNDSGEDVWTVIGYYEHHLKKIGDRWKVDRMKFTATIIEGNNDLPKLAMEAVKSG